jgi:hypothetical protein
MTSKRGDRLPLVTAMLGLPPEREAGLCHPGSSGRLRPQAERAGRARRRDHPA